MLIAVIVTIVTLVAILLAIAAFFVLRRRKHGTHVTSNKHIRSVNTVGVKSSLEKGKNFFTPPAPKVNEGPASTGVVSERLRSRFLALGVATLAVFGALATKLWSMQLLMSSSYESAARENKYTTVPTPAPRGYICDADGTALVKNRSSLTVLADADVASDHDVVQRLSTVLGIPYNVVRTRILDSSSGAQSQRVVASDVNLRDVAYIAEHSDSFTGVIVQTRSVREYPYGALAAHALGYTGAISQDELKDIPEGRNLQLGDDIGKAGIEASYDDVLAGEHGERTVIADTQGNVIEVVSETQATRGNDLYLTIKAPVQYVCDKALADLVAPSGGVIGTGKGVAAAAVVLDARDGGIVAMSSFPTFSPEHFLGGISQDTWDLYNSDSSHYPMVNRCIAGTYPAASTFKAFTGMAGLQYGFADTKKTWTCTGSWDGFGSGDVQHCWNHSGHGTLDFRGGIVNSCDVVFYEIAKDFFYAGTTQGGNLSDTAMQDEVKKYNFGQTSGIDIGGEEAGRVPTPEWKSEHWRDVPSEGVWRGGDMTNTVIGQGDVLVTPLQVALGYAGIATGKIMKPHLLKEVRNAQGETSVTFEAQEITTPDVSEENLKIVRDALNGVATDNDTIASLIVNNGMDTSNLACKTGTGEVAGHEDCAWFACYAPYDDPKYVVACVVEEGGGGSAVAAPLGLKIMAATLKADQGELKTVKSVGGSSGKSVSVSSSSSSARTD
ncbi:MAG: penicillin-binding protein 2 [Eggerthellaceae bacterium]|jgi:penicillin-binding protein 2